MAKKKDGGLFFPSKRFELVTQFDGKVAPREVHYSGVTLRQWYAGMALRAIIQAWDREPAPESAAKHAFSYADAMIAFEEKENEEV